MQPALLPEELARVRRWVAQGWRFDSKEVSALLNTLDAAQANVARLEAVISQQQEDADRGYDTLLEKVVDRDQRIAGLQHESRRLKHALRQLAAKHHDAVEAACNG